MKFCKGSETYPRKYCDFNRELHLMHHKLQIVAVTGLVALRTAHFRNRAGRGLVALCLLVCAPVASAQTVLKVKSETYKGNTVTITLQSGTVITIPVSDIDIDPADRRLPPTPPPADVPNLTAAQPGIRAGCEMQWKADFTMRSFCEKQQQTALMTLRNRPMPSGDLATIRSGCMRQWKDDYHMRNFCEEQQLKALKSLGR